VDKQKIEVATSHLVDETLASSEGTIETLLGRTDLRCDEQFPTIQFDLCQRLADILAVAIDAG
jgi:hypothetical protein